MTRGVVFYLTGSGYDHMIPPSLHSLRQNYSGPVHVVCNNVSEWFRSETGKLPGFTLSDEKSNRYTSGGSKSHIWCRKAYHHMEEYPFDINLYFDIDHIWQRPLDNHSIFDTCEKSGMVACSSNIPPNSATRKKHVISDLLGRRFRSLFGTNGGCVCARRGDPLIQEWIRRIDLFLNCETFFLQHNPEEFALASLYSEKLIPAETFESISYPVGPPTFIPKLPDLSQVNIHGTRGTLIRLKKFWAIYDKVEAADFMNLSKIMNKGVRMKFEGYKKDAVD